MDLLRIASRVAAGVPGGMTDLERAERAGEDASQWHQGSGATADACSGMCEQHVEAAGAGGPDAPAHLEAARLWADAAEAEAAHLRQVEGGDWESFDTEGELGRWRAGPGKAVSRAVAVSKGLGMDVSDFADPEWLRPSRVDKLSLTKPRGRAGGPVRVDFEDWPGGRVLVTRFFECQRSGRLTSRVRVMSPEGAAIMRQGLSGYR